MRSLPEEVKPKKILYVLPTAEIGGAEQMTFLLASSHHPKAWVPEIYFLTNGPLIAQFESRGIRCHFYPGTRPRLKDPASVARAIAHLSKTVKSWQISLVHSVMTYGHLFGGPAALLAGVPEAWFQHGPTGPLDWLGGRIPTRTLFVNSEFTLSHQRRFHAWARKTRVVHCGVEKTDPARWESPAREFRARFHLDSTHLVFGLVARLSPLKGHLLFIEAASRLIGRFPHARFLMIGDSANAGPASRGYRDQVLERIRAFGLQDKVIFTGPIPYPQYPALAACDVIVNASIMPEAFGLSLVEGMMLEKAVIGPNAGGPDEILHPDHDALLFAQGNAEDLARQMSALAENPALREKLGKAGRASACARFTIDRMVEEVEDEYDSIVSFPLA